MEDLNILAIETSCDETAAAVVRNGREVVSQALYTQIEIHKEYGGVVPEIASRNHVKKLPHVVEAAVRGAGGFERIDAVGVTFRMPRGLRIRWKSPWCPYTILRGTFVRIMFPIRSLSRLFCAL